MNVLFNFEPTKVYYVKMISGEELITEVYVQGDEKSGFEYFFINPMQIYSIESGDMQKLVTKNVLSEFLVDDPTMVFNPNSIIFVSDKLTQELLKIYDSFLEYMENPENPISVPEHINAMVYDEDQSEVEDEFFNAPPSRTLH